MAAHGFSLQESGKERELHRRLCKKLRLPAIRLPLWMDNTDYGNVLPGCLSNGD